MGGLQQLVCAPCCRRARCHAVHRPPRHPPGQQTHLGSANMGPSEEGGSPASDELSPVQRERAIGAVLSYMVLKVSMDCSTISVWPLLLKNLYGGNVALAAAAAATTSSICGLGELLITPAVGKLSDRYGRRAFFLIGPLANVAVSLLQIRFQVSVSLSRCLSVSLSLCLSLCLLSVSEDPVPGLRRSCLPAARDRADALDH